MTAHKHAENMALYAQDAAETENPHLLWECRRRSADSWVTMETYPTFNPVFEYRRKTKTIRIGERDVPEPMRVAPATGTVIWMPSIWYQTKASSLTWCNTSENTIRIERGLCHDNREAAIAHAEALILISGGTL